MNDMTGTLTRSSVTDDVYRNRYSFLDSLKTNFITRDEEAPQSSHVHYDVLWAASGVSLHPLPTVVLLKGVHSTKTNKQKLLFLFFGVFFPPKLLSFFFFFLNTFVYKKCQQNLCKVTDPSFLTFVVASILKHSIEIQDIMMIKYRQK